MQIAAVPVYVYMNLAYVHILHNIFIFKYLNICKSVLKSAVGGGGGAGGEDV